MVKKIDILRASNNDFWCGIESKDKKKCQKEANGDVLQAFNKDVWCGIERVQGQEKMPERGKWRHPSSIKQWLPTRKKSPVTRIKNQKEANGEILLAPNNDFRQGRESSHKKCQKEANGDILRASNKDFWQEITGTRRKLPMDETFKRPTIPLALEESPQKRNYARKRRPMDDKSLSSITDSILEKTMNIIELREIRLH